MCSWMGSGPAGEVRSSSLIGCRAVIESAIKTEGLMYLQAKAGQWWLEVLGMNAEGLLGYVRRISKQAS